MLVDLLRSLNPDIIGFSFRSVSEPVVLDVAGEVRNSFKDKPVILGGIGATSNPHECVKYGDFLCIGEGDYVINPLLDVIDEKGAETAEDFLHVPNLWINLDSNIHKTGMSPLVKNLDEVPYIDYSPENKYAINKKQLIENDGRYDNYVGAYPMLTSRGCPFSCTYCHNSLVKDIYKGERYCRQRSVDHVIGELRREKERNPDLKMISIYDDVFPMNSNWISDFSEKYKKYIDLPFWCFIHPNFVKHSVIEKLVSVGCNNICLGCQTFSENTLKLYDRKTSLQKLREALAILKKYNVNVQIDLISSNPLESEEDKRATFNFLIDLPKNTAFNSPPHKKWGLSISRLTLFPNTVIYNLIQERKKVTGEYMPVVENDKWEAFWEMLYQLTLHDYLPKDELVALANSYEQFSAEYADCTIEDGIIYVGEKLYAQEDYREALQVFMKLTEIAPESHVSWNNVGVALTSLELMDEAEKCFRKSLAIKDDYKEAINNLDAICAMRG
jgi:radical SAM superfamily enzyme YgiQ (UPF0313 family)